MTAYAGFDVSDKMTTICVVDAEGTILKRDAAPSDPEVLAKWLARHCPKLARVVLETGPLSTFLYHGLAERGDRPRQILDRADQDLVLGDTLRRLADAGGNR